MKKLISLSLAVCVLLGCLLPLASAAQTEAQGPIALRVNSDVAGCTEKDYEQIVEILSPQVTYYTDGSNPISIATYAGGGEYAHMEAGRSYSVTCTLVAADGYTLPEELAEGDVSFECGKGAKVVYCKVAEMHVPNPDPHVDARVRVLRIIATIVVDGTPFQRVIGWIRDIILKIRSWQLY
ncbi:MAG: hypothetical protein IJK89_04120 [Clostridia bacterium]|nr:hypothetical protein [Clostridia bacterium]